MDTIQNINMLELRQGIGQVLDKTYYQKSRFLIKRNQKEMAVLIPLEDYRIHFVKEPIEEYSTERIKEFAAVDKIDSKTRKKIEKILAE